MTQVIENCGDKIGLLAVRAMLYEVSAAPKPGLVDRFGSNAHKDMDVFTFIDSSTTLMPYFKNCFYLGAKKIPIEQLLPELKPIGILAEQQMYAATGGVNTHKGLIFSLGLICASLGFHISDLTFDDSYEWVDKVCQTVAMCVKPHFESEIEILSSSKTYGSKQYVAHGRLGARGQALAGYLHLREVALPRLISALDRDKLTYNDAMLVTLLELISSLDDSNVMGKWGERTLLESQLHAQQVLKLGHFLTAEGRAAYVAYCEWSLQESVSHGGAADLLAVSVFIHKIHTEFSKKTFA